MPALGSFARELAALVVLLAGCVSVRTPEAGQPVRLGPGEAFAFGRLRLFEEGSELQPWSRDPRDIFLAAGVPEIRLALFRVESEERFLYASIGEDGWFGWVLPEGTWLVYRSSQGLPAWHDVLCAFQVRARPEAQVLGELALDIEIDPDAAPDSAGYSVASLAVRRDPGAAREALARRHPGAQEGCVESPLAVDPELRGLFDDWKKARARQVLARLGFSLFPE